MQRGSSGNPHERRVKEEDEAPVEAHPQTRPVCAPVGHKWKISTPVRQAWTSEMALPSHQLARAEALRAHGSISLSCTKPETLWEVPKHRTQTQWT